MMATGMIGASDESYLALSADGIDYVMPLSDVGQVVADVPDGTPVISLAGSRDDHTQAIVFHGGSGFAALLVGQVSGLVQIPPSAQFEMPERARSQKNRWIAGIAFLADAHRLCYLLDCRLLESRFLQGSS